MKKTIKYIILCCMLLISICSIPSVKAASDNPEDRYAKSVVRIFNFYPSGSPDMTLEGSGFFINEKGFIITNYHLIKSDHPNPLFFVIYRHEKGLVLAKASLMVKDLDRDLAVLHIETSDENADTFVPLPILSEYPVAKSGEDVWSVGYPASLDTNIERNAIIKRMKKLNDDKLRIETYPLNKSTKQFSSPSIFKGTVGRISNKVWGATADDKNNITTPEGNMQLEVIEHNALISGGSSGGPLLDSQDMVVGINTQRQKQAGYCWASSAAELAKFLDKHNIAYIKGEKGMDKELQMYIYIGIGIVILLALGFTAFFYLKNKNNKDDSDEGGDSFTGQQVTFTAPPPPPTGELQHRESKPPVTPKATSEPKLSGASITLSGKLEDGTAHSCNFSLAMIQANGGKLIIGRNANQAQIVIADPSISRSHAALIVKNGALYLQDLGGSSVTRINGITIDNAKAQLHNGDSISLGNAEFTISI